MVRNGASVLWTCGHKQCLLVLLYSCESRRQTCQEVHSELYSSMRIRHFSFFLHLWNHSGTLPIKSSKSTVKINKHFFRQNQLSLNFWRTQKNCLTTRNYPVKFLVLTMKYWASTPKRCPDSSGHCVLIFSQHTNSLCCCHNTSQQLLLPVALAGCYRYQTMQHCNTVQCSQWVWTLLCREGGSESVIRNTGWMNEWWCLYMCWLGKQIYNLTLKILNIVLK